MNASCTWHSFTGRLGVSQSSGDDGGRLSAHRRVYPLAVAGGYERVSVLHRGRFQETGEVAEAWSATPFKRHDDINRGGRGPRSEVASTVTVEVSMARWYSLLNRTSFANVLFTHLFFESKR